MLLTRFLTIIIFVFYYSVTICLSEQDFIEDSDDEFETFLDVPPIDSLGRNAMTFDFLKWPKGIIPYELSKSLTEIEKNTILGAISVFGEKTCIQFIPKTKKHFDWLRFEKGKGCGTGIGYFKGRTSPMKLTLNKGCLQLPIAIQHETMHVMGIFHEQCRYDRDQYIDVLWENIPEKRRNNFIKIPQIIGDSYGIEYEYESLMHYKASAFAKKGTNITMRPKKEMDSNGKTIVLGYVGGPTERDFLKINRMYSCKNFL